MVVRHGILIAVFLCCASADAGQSVKAPPAPQAGRVQRQAVSTFEMKSGKDGSLTCRTVNRRFTLAPLPPDADHEALLLRETFDISCDLDPESRDGVVNISAFPVSKGKVDRKPLWTFKGPGDTGTITETMYRVTQTGCCGSGDLNTFVSLRTGSLLFTSSGPIQTVTVPATNLKRFIAFHDTSSDPPPPEARDNPTVVGVLVFGGENAQAERLVVRGPEESEGQLKSIRLLVEGKPAETRELELWPEEDSGTPASMTGFTVEVSLRLLLDDPDMTTVEGSFQVPVEGGRFAVDKASVSEGFPVHIGGDAGVPDADSAPPPVEIRLLPKK